MSAFAALLAGFYVETGAGVLSDRQTPPESCRCVYTLDRNRIQNPYAFIAAGTEVAISPRVTFAIEARHQSTPTTRRDRGDDGLWVSVRVHPFRR